MVKIIHEGDQAIAGAVAMVLPWAEEGRCVWHEIHHIIRRARDGQDEARQGEVIQQEVLALRANGPPSPRTVSPIGGNQGVAATNSP